MHSSYDGIEIREDITQQTGVEIELDTPLSDGIGKPLYEVKLDCTFDADNGDIHVTHFNGVELLEPSKVN